MKLIDLVIELRFNGKAGLVKGDLRLDLIKKVSPQDPIIKQLEGQSSPGVRIAQKNERLIVTAEENRYGVSLQDKNVSRAKEKATKHIQAINNLINYEELKVARIGIRTGWIHKTQLPIDELTEKFKETFYSDNKLIGTASDYGLNLTYSTKKYKMGYIAGPVGKKEPIPLITFPVNDLNDSNLFVSLDCYNSSDKPMTVDEIITMLAEAINDGQQKAQETISEMGV